MGRLIEPFSSTSDKMTWLQRCTSSQHFGSCLDTSALHCKISSGTNLLISLLGLYSGVSSPPQGFRMAVFIPIEVPVDIYSGLISKLFNGNSWLIINTSPNSIHLELWCPSLAVLRLVDFNSQNWGILGIKSPPVSKVYQC